MEEREMQTDKMKRRLCMSTAVLCALALASCGLTESSDAGAADDRNSSAWESVSGTEEETDASTVAAASENADVRQETSFQRDLCEFFGGTYLAIGDALCRFPFGGSAADLTELCSCRRARGLVCGDRMYWAVMASDTYQIRILKYETDGFSREELSLDGSSGLSWLDYYDGALILKNALGGVRGWRLDGKGDLREEVDAASLSVYSEEQAACTLRSAEQNENTAASLAELAEHLIPPGYSLENYGMEFLIKRAKDDSGKCSFILRQNGADTECFRYSEYDCEGPIVSGSGVYYVQKNNGAYCICRYDLDTNRTEVIYSGDRRILSLVSAEKDSVFAVLHDAENQTDYVARIHGGQADCCVELADGYNEISTAVRESNGILYISGGTGMEVFAAAE